MDPNDNRDTLPAPPPCCLHDETTDGALALAQLPVAPPAPPSFFDFHGFASDALDEP